MSTDNGKITRIYCFFMLVIIKAILYERTVAVCASMDFGKVWEDLSLEVTAGGLGRGRRL